ncbi:MAG: hypothetical protein ACKOX4_07155, partial [Bacteroidota bacterium]
MRTKGLPKKPAPVRLITLGCSKNTVDSERLATQLHSGDFEIVDESSGNTDDSQTVIINTCGFIENAKQESIDTILQYADARQVQNSQALGDGLSVASVPIGPREGNTAGGCLVRHHGATLHFTRVG